MSIHTIILTIEVDTKSDFTAELVAQHVQQTAVDSLREIREAAEVLGRPTTAIVGGRSADSLCGACRCNAVAHHPDNCLVGCLVEGCGCSRTQLTA